MNDVTTRLFIYSVYQLNKSTEDNYKTDVDEASILVASGWEHESVEGVYQGRKESSFIVQGDNNAESFVAKRAKQHKQECYMVVNNDKTAELVFNDGSRKVIGKWTKVEGKPEGKDYTKTSKGYYVVR